MNPTEQKQQSEIVRKHKEFLFPAVATYYQEPLALVKGEGEYVSGGISKIEFLSGQGVIITSGMDNALKSCIFDEQIFSAVPRPLHSRSGHAAVALTRPAFTSDRSKYASTLAMWLTPIAARHGEEKKSKSTRGK